MRTSCGTIGTTTGWAILRLLMFPWNLKVELSCHRNLKPHRPWHGVPLNRVQQRCTGTDHQADTLFAMQLFPYHLAPYICRMLRITPFRYYSELLYNVMREEKSYDQIPNFAVRSKPRILGIDSSALQSEALDIP